MRRIPDDDGQVVIFVAALLAALLVVAALVIDIGNAKQSARGMQAAADSAALAASAQILDGWVRGEREARC